MNKPAARIRFAVAGTGGAARAHLAVLAARPDVEIRGIAGRRPEAAAALAKEFHIPWRASSIEELVQSEQVDAVVAALPPFLHPDVVVKAFRAGKHVLCEKPMAPTLAQAQSMADEWRRSGRVGMVNFCYRLIPQIEEFFSRVKAGECGQVHRIAADWILPNRLNPDLTFHWKGQRELGGGVLQNIGVHALDYLFCDDNDVELLGAHQSVFVKTRRDEDGIERESTGDEVTTALFKKDGSTISMHFSLVTKPGVGHRISAYGSAGILEVRNLNPRSPCGPFSLWKYTDSMEKGECLSQGESGGTHDFTTLFSRTIGRFIEAIQTGNAGVRPSITDGLRAVQWIERIQRAAAGQVQQAIR